MQAKRAKIGRPSGRTTPPPDNAPAAQKLTWALERVGTERMSIAPHVLEDYDAILDAPRVRASALSPEATKRELATIARDVLTTIVTIDLPNETDRLVGQAILAANHFAGKKVEQRKGLLNELKDGCSPDGYKRRRPRVLGEIVSLLLGSERARTDRIRAVSYADHALALVAASAATLYYAGVGALFSWALEEALGEAPGYVNLRRSLVNVWYQWPTVLFDRFAAFSESVTELREVSTGDLDAERRAEVESLTANVRDLHESAVSHGPFPPDSPDLGAVQTFTRQRSMSGWADPEVARNGHELFVSTWMSWYGRQMHPINRHGRPKDKSPEYSDLTIMLHKTTTIVHEIGQSVTYGDITPMAAERTRTHRALSYFHDMDSYAPVFNGQSLRIFADQVFDQLDAMLARGPIIWDYVTIEELIPGGKIARNPMAGY